MSRRNVCTRVRKGEHEVVLQTKELPRILCSFGFAFSLTHVTPIDVKSVNGSSRLRQRVSGEAWCDRRLQIGNRLSAGWAMVIGIDTHRIHVRTFTYENAQTHSNQYVTLLRRQQQQSELNQQRFRFRIFSTSGCSIVGCDSWTDMSIGQTRSCLRTNEWYLVPKRGDLRSRQAEFVSSNEMQSSS